jgi:hypothetical protein
MNLMRSMALPSAPLRERLFNDFIGGSFFMWTILTQEKRKGVMEKIFGQSSKADQSIDYQ